MTRNNTANPGRRSMLGIAVGLTAAITTTSAVAVQSARADEPGEIERLVEEYHALYLRMLERQQANLPGAHDDERWEPMHAIMDRIVAKGVTTDAEIAAVSTLASADERGGWEYNDFIEACLRRAAVRRYPAILQALVIEGVATDDEERLAREQEVQA